MGKRWHYCGDMNIEHGGYFWQEDGAADYVNAVRVTPCSDAGGPSNLFWVEVGSIYLGTDAAEHKRALDCCGWIKDDAKLTAAQRRAQLVEAMVAYRGVERDVYGDHVVQVGAKREPARDCESIEPAITIRGNADLRNFIRKRFLSN